MLSNVNKLSSSVEAPKSSVTGDQHRARHACSSRRKSALQPMSPCPDTRHIGDCARGQFDRDAREKFQHLSAVWLGLWSAAELVHLAERACNEFARTDSSASSTFTEVLFSNQV